MLTKSPISTLLGAIIHMQMPTRWAMRIRCLGIRFASQHSLVAYTAFPVSSHRWHTPFSPLFSVSPHRPIAQHQHPPNRWLRLRIYLRDHQQRPIPLTLTYRVSFACLPLSVRFLLACAPFFTLSFILLSGALARARFTRLCSILNFMLIAFGWAVTDCRS